MTQLPYVSRPEAEAFLNSLEAALQAPAEHPVVFHVYGIGGVGKSTLTRKVKEANQDKAKIATVSFGLTEGIDQPIPLMAKLYGQIVDKDAWNRDPFWDKYDLYFETVHQLETQPVSGRGTVDSQQVDQVKQLLQLGVEWLLPEPGKKVITPERVDRAVDATVAGLSLRDSMQQLLNQHRATRRNQELQRLMLEPLPQLTQAFAAGLSQQAQQQPLILVLDTYEKVPSTVDTWLWRTLLGNTDIATSSTRLVIAGRHCIRRTEGWRKLHQDRNTIFDRTIERFDLAQTKDYLSQINLTDAAQVEQIFQVTKGLPYYLNWIREQTEKGQTPDFFQGNQEIVRLLLQGLNETQTLLVQLAACCRWFDSKLIRYLTEQHDLDFATAADERQNCFGWLTQLSFVEPAGQHWRLDDVARDIFRQSLAQDDRDNTHQQLAQYFESLSDQEVEPDTPTSEKYQNPDWLNVRADYLYHLLFTRQADVQTIFLSHLLEARYFGKDELVQIPLRAIEAEFELASHPLLKYSTRQFLQNIRSIVNYGWAVLEYGLTVLEEVSTNYPYNERKLCLSESEVDQAVRTCLQNPEQFEDLARFTALLYKAKRCVDDQKLTLLQQAHAQAEALIMRETPEFGTNLFLYKLGGAFYEANAFSDAIACCDHALSFKSDHHDALTNKGLALFKLGRHEEAIIAYDAAIFLKPDYHKALTNKGLALFNLGRYEEALAAYDAAIAIKPDDPTALNNKGSALFKLGCRKEALTAYDTAITLSPNYHETLNNKGVVLRDLGLYEEAIAVYNAAIALNPNDHLAFNSKGIALADLGRYEEAIEAYDAAIAIKPDYHEVISNKGAILCDDLARYEDALSCFEQVLALKPDYHEALSNKGVVLFKLDRYEEALAAYDAAIAIKPDDYNALYNKGSTLRNLGHHEEAVEAYDAAIAIKPDYPEALNNKGIALSNLGRTEETIAAYDAAISLKPDYYEALLNRGNVYFANGQLDQALADFDRALELQPENQQLIAQRALVRLQMGDSSQLAAAQQALAMSMADPKVFNKIQTNFQRALKGELSETQQKLMQQTAASLNPEGGPFDPEAWQAQIQEYQDFVTEHQSLIQKNPEAWGHFVAAMMSDDIETTINQLQAAIDLVPEYRELIRDDPDSWDTLRDDERFRALVEGSDGD